MLDRHPPHGLRHQARARRQAHAPGGRRDQRARARACRTLADEAFAQAHRRAPPALPGRGPSSTTSSPRPSRWCREAAAAPVGMRHFDVQLMGGMVLHAGKIAEMATGEGKTLVATLPAYLNAPHRPGHPHRHGQRLPGPPRRPVDGPDLPRARAHGRRSSSTRCRSSTIRPTSPSDIRLAAAPAVSAAGGVPTRRHHLRHQQRVRLRLPARQHALLPRGAWSSASTTTRSSTRSTRS